MSDFWLVETESDLERLRTTRSGVWHGVRTVNGVKSVTDLSAVTLMTLATMLLSNEEFLRALGGVRRRIRSPERVFRTWSRMHQPRLPEVN